jgi:membrane protein DedA with SNARE-associated domain
MLGLRVSGWLERDVEIWLQDIFSLIPGGTVFILAVFLIAYFEALVGIGLVMPGSVLTVFSGWLAFQGKGSILIIMTAAGIGALLGDLVSYWLGAHYGPQLWKRGLLKKRQHLLQLAEVFFLEHGGKSVFFGRFLGPIRGLIPFVAGASRMPPGGFFAYSTISGLLWGLSYPGLGYLGGTSWQRAETLAGRLGLLVLLALSVTLVAVWLRHHFLPKRQKD